MVVVMYYTCVLALDSVVNYNHKHCYTIWSINYGHQYAPKVVSYAPNI
jgi:hypothetical protein